jgi:beta-glucosidase
MGTSHIRYGAPDAQVEARVEGLLAQMTLEEKVGQMNQLDPRRGGDLEGEIRAGQVGSLLSITDVRAINRFQRIAVQESRLGIPLIVGNDVIHGYRTVFPIPLAGSCTWNPALIERSEQIAAAEAAACGTDWIFAPMLDICRNPRWGRIAEGAGEDPFLGEAMAAARVRGFQSASLPAGRRIVTCPKHYVAYGATESGRDYDTVDLSERTLRDIYLPPFKAAFDAGAGSVMSAFNEINGVPASANPLTLRTVLRQEWGFEGVVLSDYNAIRELIDHGFAADLQEAALKSVLTGVDMDMMGHAYSAHLVELVRGGHVPEAVVDEAVRRILRLKAMLGLMDRPYTDEALQEEIVLCDEHRQSALEVAHRSMVLLKNEGGVLPLAPAGRVAVIGPLADDHDAPLGCWRCVGQSTDVESVLDGIRQVWSDPSLVTYAKGCPIEGDREDVEWERAVQAAREVDVVVLALGESARMSGEAKCRAHLDLPGQQQALLEAVYATGTPVVVVLLSGRPLVIPWMAEHVPAILSAWHGGIRAGRAVADLLTGRVDPSGRLTAGFPRAEGQIPVYYAHKSTGRPIRGEGTRQFDEAFRSSYLDEPNTPLYPFGYGLGYTTFTYADLEVETPAVGLEDVLAVSATVSNTGGRPGVETAQLYVRDLVGTVTRPVKELKGFQQVALSPGESRRVRFEVPVSSLGFHGLDVQYVVEPGEFRVWIGPHSDEGLEGAFTIV